MDAPDHPLAPAWADAFSPGARPPAAQLWANEARPWSEQLIAHYLQAYSAPGDLVLDPFAAQAPLPLAANTSRRRIWLSHFSPAAILAVRASAAAPARSLLDSVFSRIADAPRRGRTLGHNLRALYESVCPECAQSCTIRYFIWERDAGEPVEKGYTCPHCHSAGQAPVDMSDMDLASSLEVRGAAYWGLLSRLVAPGDPATDQARALLDLYAPRALQVIAELLTAIEQRLNDPDELHLGRALVLHVLQRCISLHAHPESWQLLDRPLLPPARFVEHNAWLAFEHAYRTLRERPAATLRLASDRASLLAPLGVGAALLASVAVPDLANHLEPGSVALILSDPPRLDPAMYALSFLWTGWLFGRGEATRLKATLNVADADWDWYCRAMSVALGSLARLLKPDGRLVLAFDDRSARLALALLAAAGQAGLRLMSQAVQAPLLPDDDLPGWRLVFGLHSQPQPRIPAVDLGEALRQAAQAAARQVLAARAEPTPTPLLYTACAARWNEDGLLAHLSQHQQAGRKPVSFLSQQLRLALSPDLPPAGLRFHPLHDDTRYTQWEQEQTPEQQPLADRVETAIASLLTPNPQASDRLLAQVYASFPGWETPDAALLAACLESYAVSAEGLCSLRPEDAPQRRAQERGEILLRLHDLGNRLGFDVWVAPWAQATALGLAPLGQGGPAVAEEWAPAGVVWHEAGQAAYVFALALDAVLHPWLQPLPETLSQCPHYVVLPGGRSGLIDFKLRRCPAWRARLAEIGWEVVKFRHVRQLAAMESLTLAGFWARIGLDPVVTQPGQQLTLFGDPANLQGATDVA